MSLNSLRHVQLLKIFLLFIRQRLPPNINRFLYPLHATEPDDRARDAFVEPCKRNMAHLPALLFRELLHPIDDGLIGLTSAGWEPWLRYLAARSCR